MAETRHVRCLRPNQRIKILQESSDWDHIHLSQIRVGARHHLATPEDADGKLFFSRIVLLLVQLKDDLRAHSRPDHLVDLQDGEQFGQAAVMGDIVSIDDRRRSPVAVSRRLLPYMLCQLADPYPEYSGAGSQRGGRVPVHVGILKLAEAEDGIGLLGVDTCTGIVHLTGKGFPMTESRSQVVEIMVVTLMPVCRV